MTFKNILFSASAIALMASASFATTQTGTGPAESKSQEKTAASKDGSKPLSLEISGNITTLAGAVSQEDNGNGKSGGVTLQVPGSDLNFKVSGQASNGLKYGYLTRVKALCTSVDVTRSYVELSKDFWVFQVGNVKGPDDTMGTYGAYALMGGSGGALNGSLDSFYNMSAGTIYGTTITGSPGIATKAVTYLSWNGFKFGLSFTPDTSHRSSQGRDNSRVTTKGDAGNESAIYPNEQRYGWGLNNFTLGLSYEKEFGDYRLNLNAVTIREKGRFVFLELVNSLGEGTAGSRSPFALQPTLSYMFAAQFGYKNVDFAVGYLNNINSRLMTKEMEERLIELKSGLGALKDEKDPTQGRWTAKDINDKVKGADWERKPVKNLTYFVDNSSSNTYEGNAGKAWNVGAKYTGQSFDVGLGYFNTDRKTDAINEVNFQCFSVTADYKVLNGLVLFGEVNYAKSRTNEYAFKTRKDYEQGLNDNTDKVIGNNSGTVVMLGTKVSF